MSVLALPRLVVSAMAFLFASCLLTTLPVSGAAQEASARDIVRLAAADAELTGLELLDGVARVSSDPLFHPALSGEGLPAGIAVWPPVALPMGAASVSVTTEGGSGVELEVRFSSAPDGDDWTSWHSLVEGVLVPAATGARLQTRAVLSGPEGNLQHAELRFLPGEVASVGMAQSAATNPTVRLWATREGLVGGRTANGHHIVERDRFVALPSRRALAKLGGNEYQVRLAYNGRTATAPVWDVGPWNTKDNYWDLPAERELFKDLPRFVPEAWAAWKDGYNGGRDQFGRWVTYPASIDIADGTFWDDLGMKSSDWVDVTFQWVNAPSPPLPTTNPRVAPKPAPASGTVTAASLPAEPPAGQRWYFAEGSTKEPFHTWLLLQNPHSASASVTITYMLLDGSARSQALQLKPTSRLSVFVNEVVPEAEFSTRIESDRPIFAERAMYFRRDGHATAGAMRTAARWCFAEGSTRDGADTWLLLQNPGADDARVTVGFFLEGGGVVRHALDLPRTSRRSLYANLVIPNATFGGCIESDRPIVAERAGYGANGGGTGGVIASAPSPTWYFAEGNARPGMRTTLSLANPGTELATAEVSYLVEGAPGKKRTVTIAPMGTVVLDVAADVGGTRFGTAITSDKAIVAERTTAFGPDLVGRHGGMGAPRLARTWFLAEGSTAPPFQEYLLLANPGDAAATVTAEFMRDDGSLVSRSYRVPPTGRVTVDVNVEVPRAAVSIRVSSDQPVVAERSMYWSEMTGGSSTVGVTLDS